MSLKFKITGFTLISAILPLLIAGTLIFHKVSQSLENIVRKTVTAQASEEILTVQEALNDAKHQLMTLGALSTMQDVLIDDYKGHIQYDLEKFAMRYPAFLELAVTNDKGLAIASTVPGMRYTNLESTWEYEAPRLGIVFDGPVVQSMRLSDMIATQSVPIFDHNNPGLVIGTLIGSIDWAAVQTTMASRKILGNEQGSDNQIILKSTVDDKILFATEGSNFSVQELMEAPGADNQFFKTEHGGKHYIAATADSAPIAGFRDPNWRMYVLVEEDTAYSMLNSTQRYILCAALVAMLLVSALGLFVARSITRPVQKLVKTAERIADGNFNHPIDTRGRDEIGQLASSIKFMRDSVKANQTELVRKTEVAELAAKTKGEFLANMSHEVRTPINGVLGMTELLLNTELSSTQHRYASTISRSGESLLSVINDILDFSKIEAGKLSLQHGPFDLRDLVEDLTELLAESAHRKNVDLNLVLAPDEHSAYSGDASRVRQILFNLIGNAIKFTEEGEVVVNVSSIEHAENRSTIQFSIRDTGVGIAEDVQDKIFESFVQADGSTTRKFGGTGLGLAISARLVELMDGELTVESTPGVGSVFSFTASVEKLAESHNIRWKKADCLNGHRIAIIDDNATNVEILKSHVEHWGATALCATRPIAGLAMLDEAARQDELPDIVLLDMNMPKLNGLEVAKMLHTNPVTTDSKLVLLSSVCDQMKREDCAEVGVNVLLTKPIRQAELFRCLASITNTDTGSFEESELAPQPTRISAKLKGKVLLAEDNPVNQDMMQELLKIMGIECELAENGQEALDALKAGKTFDLVLMDCQMPVLDGFEATRSIRELEAQNDSTHIPIVALTANAMEGDRERCLDAGMDEYLSKPVSSNTLRTMLSNWLEDGDSTDTTGTADIAETTEIVDTADTTDTDDELTTEEANSIDIADVTAEDKGSESAASSSSFRQDLELKYSNLPTIDKAVYGEVCSMCEQASEGFYDRLYEKYVVSAKEDLQNIANALEEKDAATVGSSSHRLKSGSANWGGKRMAAYCQELETSAKADNLTNAAELVKILHDEYEILIDELRSEGNEDKAA